MTTYFIHTEATNYNPYRSYFRNFNRYARTYKAHTLEEVEAIKAEAIAKGETLTGIYNNVGKRIG